MLRVSSTRRAKYQPYALALQLRFKWRHRVDENWRRLMDASCFPIDWQTRPRFKAMSQFGGHWSHYVCAAHTIAPWDYPNFYPPVGGTRFVSKITATDCETQIRQPSLQGEIVYKTFASKFTTYIHRNPRLDLAVIHVEQALKRTSEVKMMWMQNEGFHIRPRFEMLRELEVGDSVWIYGCTARGDMFDEESRLEPLMVPTGVRGRVKLVTDEHFFVETHNEDELAGKIEMGMCGGVVIREGKCVGMLTATVASTNDDQRVANCAMCTHARDIRNFLVEVENQMKNPPPDMDESKRTVFQERREQESRNEAAAASSSSSSSSTTTTKEEETKTQSEIRKLMQRRKHKDWEADDMRLARHVKVPFSLWKMEEQWSCEEDQVASTLFGSNNGLFGKEAQEEVFGLHMTETRDDGKAPEGKQLLQPDGSKPHHTSNRPDPSPRNLYLKDSFVNNENDWDSKTNRSTEHVREFYAGAMGAEQTDQMDKWSRSVEAMNAQRAREDLHNTAMNYEQMKEAKMKQANDPNVVGGTDPYSKKQKEAQKQQQQKESSHSNTSTPLSPSEQARKDQMDSAQRRGVRLPGQDDADLESLWK